MKNVLINAIHSKAGGGLVYLNQILPYLAQSKKIKFTLLLDEAYAHKVQIPKGMNVWKQSFKGGLFSALLWEQLVLPFKSRQMGFDAVFCNANYVPLLSKNPIPTIHNNAEVIHYCQGVHQKIYWKVIIFLTRLSLAFSPFSFAGARHVAAHYGADMSKVFVTYSACDLKKVKGNSKPFSLLAIGDIYVQKNYMLLLQVLKVLKNKYPDVHLNILGRPIDDDQWQRLKSFVDFNGLENFVTFTSWVDYNDLPKLFAKNELFVNASVVETFNMPVLEAMKCGKPVVLLDFDYQRQEIAREAGVYVSREGDIVQNYVSAIEGLWKDRHLMKRHALLGEKLALDFSWKKTAKVILDKLENGL